MQFDDAALHEALKSAPKPVALFGVKAYMALTIDPQVPEESADKGTQMERYQGIVPLDGDTLAEAALEYFHRSVQIDTALRLVAQPLNQGDNPQWRVGGIMVQKLAAEGGAEILTADPDAWNRTATLMQTAADDELLDAALPLKDLLWRLFHEDGVRAYDARTPRFACPCSRARVYNMLMRLPHDEQESMQDDPQTEVRCEFCNEIYQFSAQELTQNAPMFV